MKAKPASSVIFSTLYASFCLEDKYIYICFLKLIIANEVMNPYSFQWEIVFLSHLDLVQPIVPTFPQKFPLSLGWTIFQSLCKFLALILVDVAGVWSSRNQ